MSTEQDLNTRINNYLSVLGTLDTKWALLRANGVEDGAAPVDPESVNLDWSAIITQNDQSGADGIVNILQSLGPGVNGAEIAFFSDKTDAENDTFDFEIYAWRSGPYGPAVRVCSTTGNACILGSMDCVIHPVTGVAQAAGLWCDTIAISDHWDGATVVNSAAPDQIARVIFDLRGYKFLQVRVFNAGAGGTECGRIGAIVSGY